MLVCALGLLFGLVTYMQLRELPVHKSMLEISELIYETCKTYLITQGKFLLILWNVHRRHHRVLFRLAGASAGQVDGGDAVIILLFSVIGIAGSYGVAWFGIRVNTFANSRTAFASLRANRFPAMRFRCRPA